MIQNLKKFEWQRDGVLVAFAIFVGVALLFQGSTFSNPLIWRNLLTDNAAVGLIAVGMTLVIIGGGIDLSVGSMLALLGVTGLQLMGAGSSWVAVIVMVLGGIALGFLQGALVTWGRIAPFVATLVGLLVFRSLALVFANGGTIISKNPGWSMLATDGPAIPFLRTARGTPIELFWSAFLFLAVALGLHFLLESTPYGRRLVAVGSNEKAAKYSAVNVNMIRIWSYVILGFCVGLAAWVKSSELNSVASSNAGQLYELEAIAAVVIGGTALTGGRGRVWGTVIGVMFLGLITTMLVAAEVSSYLQGVVKGGIILAAVLVSRGAKSAD